MRRQDLFAKIASFRHHLAICTTFTLDIEIIEKIYETSRGRVFILHDRSNGVTCNSTFDGRLCLRPAKIGKEKGIFHPKIILLIGKDRVALCVGSANLANEAFRIEKETCAWIELDRRDTELSKIVSWLGPLMPPGWEFLCGDDSELRIASGLITNEHCWKFIHNSENPISREILRTALEEWRLDMAGTVCHIASPFWLSQDKQGLVREWFLAINASEFYLYSRSTTGLGPFPDCAVYERKPVGAGGKGNFHSKMVLFEWPDKDNGLLFIGSANFTEQGFFSSSMDFIGNVECGILVRLQGHDLKDCLDWFKRGWSTPIIIEQSNIEHGDDKKPEVELYSSPEPYFWAEIDENAKKFIKLGFPDTVGADKVSVKEPQGKAIIPSNILPDCACGTFSCDVPINCLHRKEDEEIIIVLYDNEPHSVPVLRKEQFQNAYQKDGCGLFDVGSSLRRYRDVHSIEDMVEHIKKHGIISDKIGGVIEPPAIEEFYRLWRARIANIKRIITGRHISELKKVLDNLRGAYGLYVILHLEKALHDIASQEIFELLKTAEVRYREETFPGEAPDKWTEFKKKWLGAAL